MRNVRHRLSKEIYYMKNVKKESLVFVNYCQFVLEILLPKTNSNFERYFLELLAQFVDSKGLLKIILLDVRLTKKY